MCGTRVVHQAVQVRHVHLYLFFFIFFYFLYRVPGNFYILYRYTQIVHVHMLNVMYAVCVHVCHVVHRVHSLLLEVYVFFIIHSSHENDTNTNQNFKLPRWHLMLCHQLNSPHQGVVLGMNPIHPIMGHQWEVQ